MSWITDSGLLLIVIFIAVGLLAMWLFDYGWKRGGGDLP